MPSPNLKENIMSEEKKEKNQKTKTVNLAAFVLAFIIHGFIFKVIFKVRLGMIPYAFTFMIIYAALIYADVYLFKDKENRKEKL